MEAYTITLRNDSDYDLYIRGRDSSGNTYEAVTLLKRDTSTSHPTVYSHDYTFDLSQKKIINGNLFGCWGDPSGIDVNAAYDMQKKCAMAKMTIDQVNGYGNADVSFVDAISMPIQLDVEGTGCNAGASTTNNVYGCDGGFFNTDDGKPYCAAINRGVLSLWNNQSDPAVIAQFYQAANINEYAKWIHNILGTRGYTFPYDDYPADFNQALDLGFSTSSKLTITFFSDQTEHIYLPILFRGS